MTIELPRWMRAMSSGIGFTIFGVGSLLLIALGFPLIRLMTHDAAARERWSRACIKKSFRVFVLSLIALGGIRVSYRGREHLSAAGPLLVIANHPSLIDVCLLVGWVDDADCVVKREAWSNPFLGGVMRAAGYIPNDGGDELIETCVARLREGRKLLLFPEGTRSPKGELRAFKRGAARIALQAACPVLIADIDCRPPFLGKGDPWYQVPRTLPCYTITAHEPAVVRAGRDESSGEASRSEASEARRLTQRWRRGFEERLGHV
jgi:1-acyl-sn-glycerol-3-phosphate acyltransferase